MEYAKNIVAVKTFVEPALVRGARKDLGVLLSPYSNEIKLAIAKAFDESLVVSLSDAINKEPIISGVNVELFLLKVKESVNFGSTFEHNLAKLGATLNVALTNRDDAVRFAMVGIEDKHMIPFVVADNHAQEKYLDIQGVCLNVTRDQAIICLVFHFGFKVAQAELVYDSFRGE